MSREALDRAMAQESPQGARALVQPMLAAAEVAGDLPLQARALAGLAACDLLLCEYREAQAHATRAAHLFESLGDAAQEANALTIIARSASALGRNEVAVEADLLAVALARQSQEGRVVADTLMELGLSLTHSRSFDAARAVLEEAEEIARSCGCDLEELVALARQGTGEMLRIITLRHETGEMPALDHARALLARWQRFKDAHDMVALAEPDQRPIQMYLELLTGLFLGWCGETEAARRTVQPVGAWLGDTDVSPWIRPFEALTACELALVDGDWPQASCHADRLLESSAETGNEQIALLGHTLRCRVFEMQRQPEQALREAKAMAARERRIRAEGLTARHEVVGWRLDMRRSEQSRKELQASARQLEKLSLEDPLTGIANRRCFEAEVAVALHGPAAERGVCLALLDVDRFKQVNDQHGHLIGDKVLQVVAALLGQHVRHQDLAARLAGDEFVVLFRNIDERAAWDICERLRSAVAAYPWSDFSPGLTVGVSVGVAQSLPGETVESLMARSDKAMYARKPAPQRTS